MNVDLPFKKNSDDPMLFISTPSPDGRSTLIDIETGSVHRTFKSDPAVGSYGVAYSRATEVCVLPQDKPCLFQFTPCMQQPVQRSFTTEKVTACAFSPCGKILAGGSCETGCIYIWDVLTGDMLRLVKGHLRRVNCLSFNADGSMLASASDDSSCKVWAVGSLVSSTHSIPSAEITFTAHTLAINCCAFFSFSDIVATGSQDRTIKVFFAKTGVQIFSVMVEVPITTLRVDPCDALLVAGGQQGHLFFVALKNQEAAQDIVQSRSYCISKDSTWTPELRKRTPVEGGHSKSICFIGFLPDKPNNVIVASEDGTILVWETLAIRVVQEIGKIKKGICSVAMLSHLSVDAIPQLRYDLCVPLAKYPVDPTGEVGYSVPQILEPSATETKKSLHPGGELPNVKYNKGKQKRLREELAQAAAAEEQLKRKELEEQRVHEAAMKEWAAKTEELEQMAVKLRSKLQKLESKAK